MCTFNNLLYKNESDLQYCTPGSKQEKSEDREWWREIVEAAKALKAKRRREI